MDRFEVKRLVAVTADGLERWDVLASVALPLDPPALKLATDIFGTRGWTGGGIDGRSAERLRASLADASASTLVIDVEKRRKRYGDGRVIGEVTEVRVPDHDIEAVTIGIESASEARLSEFVRNAGLADLPNLGYGAFLGYLADTGIAPVSATPRHLQPAFP
jgi:hypothetical protein